MSAIAADTVRFEPLGETIAADVPGIDLTDITDAEFEAIRDGLWRFLVLRFRDQHLDDETHLALNARFGQLDYTPEKLMGGEHRIPEMPFMEVVSNIVEEGKPIGALGDHELTWHSDMSFLKRPYGPSILRSLELPSAGGDTSFGNAIKALEELPADLRRAIEGKSTLQDGFLDRPDGKRRANIPKPKSGPVPNQYDGTGAVHPIVCTHPPTGQKYLYLGRRPRSSIVGMDKDESDALLDALWAHLTQPRYSWTQHWRLGDVIFWDNRCTIHHRTPFDGAQRRILHRTAALGEVPA